MEVEMDSKTVKCKGVPYSFSPYPSETKEEALSVVPNKEKGVPFFALNTSDGVVALFEFDGDPAVAAALPDSVAYRKCKLASLSVEYTDDAAYQESKPKFQAEVCNRDLRIVGI